MPPKGRAPRQTDLAASAAVQPIDAATLAAQGITAALLPLTQAPEFRNQLLLQLARSLRHTLADELHPATTTRERIDRSIARAMATILPPGSPAEQIADLRLFAHLTLSECADLLDRPRCQVLQMWRPTRRLLFRWVRSNLCRRAIPQPPGAE